jgi:hypothetical protein
MAEEIFGKLFTKEEADKEFGSVIASYEIETKILSDMCDKFSNVLMFSFNNETAAILGSGRTPVYPNTKMVISEDEKLKVYSISRIKELIAEGGVETTIIEKRKDHLTITNGETTLENAGDCPPFCS